ncbi:hypothetical protein D0Z07_7373 [Hyphodiscus hymeniophilus]|uniref:Uncharacterized protein n=1 Tax=Hyphodiscus hymeniophilus TaxID=353542 RepID=A0A9P7AUN2_9HELO|nr:hypothetical protein D0Z07_7373 [Hyphodiscus hymeniophilus]
MEQPTIIRKPLPSKQRNSRKSTMPGTFPMSHTMTSQVNLPLSETCDRYTMPSVHEDESVIEEMQHLNAMERPKIIRKPLPSKQSKARQSTMPREYPICPPTSRKLTAKGWGDEWTRFVKDISKTSLTSTDSSASVSPSSSCSSISDHSSSTSVTKRSRTVTPSSSISNLSKRSPLSTMRSIEFPDVPIPTELRYLPPVIAPPHEWNVSKTPSLAQLLPVSGTNDPPPRPFRKYASMRTMKPVPMLPPEFAPRFRRTTLDVRIPGPFTDYYHPSLEDRMVLEEHARMMEMESNVRIQGAQTNNGLVRLPSGEFEKHYTPNTLDSRTRYRQQHKAQPSDHTPQSMDNDSNSVVSTKAVKIEQVKHSTSSSSVRGDGRNLGHLRPLTISNVSPEWGMIWDEEMGSV